MKILSVNPGSTSTKVALFEDENNLWTESITHTAEELAGYPTIWAQLGFRTELVLSLMNKRGVAPADLACVVARGGLLPSVGKGAYVVGPEMLDQLENRPINHHASNLGAGIAYSIANPLGLPAFIYDPVTVDELLPISRVTGLKEVVKAGRGHALNMRAAAMRLCREKQLDYNAQNLIIAHLGGGITLSLHSQGRIIDMVSDDDGPFSPERAGLIPSYYLIDVICSQNLSKGDAMKLVQRKGGLVSHFGVSDSREVEKLIDAGDEHAKLVYEAMALEVAKNIAKLSASVCGKVDHIILTGGIAYSKRFTAWVSERISFIAPVEVLPGENEMESLTLGALRVLKGEEAASEYKPVL